MAGYRNSPVIGDNGLKATPEELNALTRNMRENFIADLDRKPIDLHNPQEVKQAIINYFIDCEKSGKRPGNMGLYRALDLTRQDVNDALRGKNKSKLSPAAIDTIKKALSILSEYREQLGAQGKLNPVTMIFWQKNFDGMTDTQQIQVSAAPTPAASMTPEEVAKQIEQDIPIDAEYIEK